MLFNQKDLRTIIYDARVARLATVDSEDCKPSSGTGCVYI